MTGVLIKRENLNTETDMHRGRMPREQEGRDMADVSASEGTPKIAIKSQGGRREAWNKFPLTAAEGTSPAHTLISHF